MIDDYAKRFLEKAILRFVEADAELYELGKGRTWAECVMAAEYLCAAVSVLLSTGIPTFREVCIESAFIDKSQPTEDDLVKILENRVDDLIPTDGGRTDRFVNAIKELLATRHSYSLSDEYQRIKKYDTAEE